VGVDDADAMLPGGFWDDAGRLHRAAWLRPLSGREEELLAGGGAAAAAVTDLLGRCLLRLGDLQPVPGDAIRRLLVADRDVLLVRLRQLTFGDDVSGDLLCPWPECGERVTISFALSELPVHEPPVRAATHTVRLAGVGDVTFRLPNGGDQEELSGWAAQAPAAALTALLARCLISVDSEPADAARVAELDPSTRATLEAEMERLAPQLESTIETKCAECGRTLVAPFDLHRCFFGDLWTDQQLLYREVHQLAFHYHWSEAEIMSMSRQKRRTYLDVLSEEIERMNDGA
jgi:hypothetical protein